jgi:Arc/MetJ-type ribon-helix-helix transcriptional regulator
MEGAMRTISVRLDDGSEARLNNLCQNLGLSQSEVVKAGLALLQQQSTSPAALAESGTASRGRDHAALLRQKLSNQHKRERQIGPQP